jgi:hypothetical protein
MKLTSYFFPFFLFSCSLPLPRTPPCSSSLMLTYRDLALTIFSFFLGDGTLIGMVEDPGIRPSFSGSLMSEEMVNKQVKTKRKIGKS